MNLAELSALHDESLAAVRAAADTFSLDQESIG